MLQMEEDAIIDSESGRQEALKPRTSWGGNKGSGKTGRRRRIDPTTTDRAYSEAEWEFMRAMEVYKLQTCRLFPTWSEAFEVLLSLGYRKIKEAQTAA